MFLTSGRVNSDLDWGQETHSGLLNTFECSHLAKNKSRNNRMCFYGYFYVFFVFYIDFGIFAVLCCHFHCFSWYILQHFCHIFSLWLHSSWYVSYCFCLTAFFYVIFSLALCFTNHLKPLNNSLDFRPKNHSFNLKEIMMLDLSWDYWYLILTFWPYCPGLHPVELGKDSWNHIQMWRSPNLCLQENM